MDDMRDLLGCDTDIIHKSLAIGLYSILALPRTELGPIQHFGSS